MKTMQQRDDCRPDLRGLRSTHWDAGKNEKFVWGKKTAVTVKGAEKERPQEGGLKNNRKLGNKNPRTSIARDSPKKSDNRRQSKKGQRRRTGREKMPWTEKQRGACMGEMDGGGPQ